MNLKNHQGNVLVPILAGVLIVALVAAGYLFWQNQQYLNQIDPDPRTISNRPASPIDASSKTADWKTYTNNKYGFSFEYPKYLTIQENEYRGETGYVLCLNFSKPAGYNPFAISKVNAGAAGCYIGEFGAGASTIDFRAGRSGGFLDGQGYKKIDTAYIFKFVNRKEYQIPQELIKNVQSNKNGVEILIVQGKSAENSPFDIPGTPGDGYIGAIINLKNALLTGLQFMYKEDSSLLSRGEFDQILSTFKFTNGDLDKNQSTSVKVFFNNTDLASDPQMLDCGKVFSVTRTVPKTLAVATAAITEWLKGPTVDEQSKGYSGGTQGDVKLNRVSISNGVAMVDFHFQGESDGGTSVRKYIAGTCGTESFISQIENTLMQFPTVKNVQIAIDGSTDEFNSWTSNP